MPIEDKTTWLSKKVQLWILIVSAITSTGGLVYATDQYLNKFATNDDVATVQRQMTELHYKAQIDDYTEQKLEIQDKIVDDTARPSDRKKLHRLDRKIYTLEKTLDNLRQMQ
jgi:hypothetical protein